MESPRRTSRSGCPATTVAYWPRVPRPALCGGRHRTGAGQRSTRLPRSIQDQAGGRPRSRGTARSTLVSFRRYPSGSTTQRTAADTSARLFGGGATGEKIDDRGLGLSVTVEPVVGDHSSRDDDG